MVVNEIVSRWHFRNGCHWLDNRLRFLPCWLQCWSRLVLSIFWCFWPEHGGFPSVLVCVCVASSAKAGANGLALNDSLCGLGWSFGQIWCHGEIDQTSLDCDWNKSSVFSFLLFLFVLFYTGNIEYSEYGYISNIDDIVDYAEYCYISDIDDIFDFWMPYIFLL